ncbi:MAG TPA: polysaccharide biosynthesis/export family protein [bacterium]|nr:polysaccharide biosynthesis/export family protein [bacterium]HQO35415.1 polysaccharide biosynthesis/export family protein [bacterium]HQP98160.1 polysaccharide biosynthesis/export family protein [bacterium]
MSPTASIVDCLRKILPILIVFCIPLSMNFSKVAWAAPEFVIDVGDILEIQVQDEPMLTVTREVDSDGTFQLPLLQKVEAAGKTPTDLARHIEKRLVDEEYLWTPRVSVKIKERPGYVVQVHGAVGQPGMIPLQEKMRIRDALERQGGILEDHAAPEMILRGRKRPTEIRIDRHLLVSKGLAGKMLNFLLRPGDEIIVPEAGRIRLVGAVKEPADVARIARITLFDFLAQAGVQKNELTGWIVLRRENADEILVDPAAIQNNRRAEDFDLQDGDCVTVLGKGVYYLGGEVAEPGIRQWDDALTLKQILPSVASKENHDEKALELIHPSPLKTMQYPLAVIQSATAQDVFIQEGDVILIRNKSSESG